MSADFVVVDGDAASDDGAAPAWPAAWKLLRAQQTYFSELVTVGRFAGGWHLAGKCFCGLDFATHNTVTTDDNENPDHRAFVCTRCKCFYMKSLATASDDGLRKKQYENLELVDITIDDDAFTQFECLVLQKTLALKMSLDSDPPTPQNIPPGNKLPLHRFAKQYAFTDTAVVADTDVPADIETTITTTQRWITPDMDFPLTVLRDHFKTFDDAITSRTGKYAFTIEGKSKSIELTYQYSDTANRNFVNVYSPGSIGISNVYLVSVVETSSKIYKNTVAFIKIAHLIAVVVMALATEPDDDTKITYYDAYKNNDTSFDRINKFEITSSAFTATLSVVFNLAYKSSVMLLCDRHLTGVREPQTTLMPFNNENIGRCVDTMFNNIAAPVTGSGNADTVKVTNSNSQTEDTYGGSIPDIKNDLKAKITVAALVPGGGKTPYLHIQSDTPQSWTGANMYKTTNSSDLKNHITDRVPTLVQESWYSGNVVLKKDGTAYRAGGGKPPVLTLFERSKQSYVRTDFSILANDICINAPNVVHWGNLKSGMSIVTDHMFWANFEANLFTPVPFWADWAATVGPGKALSLAGTDKLPTDMVYVPAWLALDILLKTGKLKFVPTKSPTPGATYSVYDIWSLIATPENGGTIAATIARVTQAWTSVSTTAVQAAGTAQELGAFAIKRFGEGFTVLVDDIASASAIATGTESIDVSVTNMAKMVAGTAAANFIAVPAVVAGSVAAAHRYSGSSAFEWTPASATSAIERTMHGGTFTIVPELYTPDSNVDSGMHYVLSSFLEHIRLLTGQTLNNEIALPRSILTADNSVFQNVILEMLAGHEISQVGDALSFSRTLTGAGLSNIFSHPDYTNRTLFQQTRPGTYINIGTYDADSGTLNVSSGNVREIDYSEAVMENFNPPSIKSKVANGDLRSVEPGTISINEPGLPPFTLPRVGATEIFATDVNFDFTTIGDTITAAHTTIDNREADGFEHPANNYVRTLGDVLNISDLYSDFHSALAYAPDPTIFEKNTLVSMAYATCIENARKVWESFFPSYTPGLVHTTAQMQCGIWSNVNMQMLHLETDARGPIWPALQHVVDHLVKKRTDRTPIDLSTIIYWLDSATPPTDGHFGPNAKIWFRFGKTLESVSLGGRSTSVMWSTPHTDVGTQITALNIYYNARLNGITASITQDMTISGVQLNGTRDRTLYPAPQPISLEMDSTLVSPSPTVVTLASVYHRAFPAMTVSVIFCACYMIYAKIMTSVSRTAVAITGTTNYSDLLLRNVQPMILERSRVGTEQCPDGWVRVQDEHRKPTDKFRFYVR